MTLAAPGEAARRSIAPFLALLLVVGAPGGLGCGPVRDAVALFGGGPKLQVRKVLVDVEPPGAPLSREEARARVLEVLSQARGLALVEGEAPRAEAAVVRVRVQSVPPAPGAGEVDAVAVTVEVSSVPGEPSGYRGQALASADPQAPQAPVDALALLERALRDALGQVMLTRNAGDLDAGALIGWLSDPRASLDQRRRAVRVLGSRREREAVDVLTRTLLAREPELSPLALAALTHIADPGAVDAIIAYSDAQPPPVVLQCIDAVKGTGAPGGRAWLFTLSTGHPDEAVQQQAAAALAALETSNKGGAALAEGERPPRDHATP